VLEAVELQFTAADAGDACPQHRNELKRPHAVSRIAQEATQRFGLGALNIHQEHVRSVLVRLYRELLEQTRLERPDPDDEERTEANGEQHHARLVAGTREVQHGMTERKRT